ncbi:MAG TPA: polysaccharide biosynthesis C-terminal domain-containing protein [Herpetosiphonaceae bacterium]|nr:polysaccharide biosynthesis C-terminal domain-containing protein [Herpetosiphonaceae bacterium]
MLYAITGIATKMIGALLLPVLTRLLSVREYGVIDLIALGSLIGLELIVIGTDFVAALYYNEPTVARGRVAGTLVLMRLIAGGGLAGAVIVAAPALSRWGFGTVQPDLVRAIRVAAVSLPLSAMLSFWIIWLRQAGRAGVVLGVTLLRVAATALVTIALVRATPDRLAAYFWAAFYVDCGLALALGALFRAEIGRPSLALGRLLLGKGVAFLPRSIYFVAMTLITRQLLLHYGSLELVGQYAAAVKVSFIVWIAINATNYAWLSYSLSIVDNPAAPTIYRNYLSDYVMFLGLCVVGVAVFASDILRLLTTPEYLSAAPAVGWLALSLMAVGSLVIVTTGLNIIKDTGVIGRTTIITALLNIGLALALIPRTGLLGAAVAAALDQGIAAVLLYRLSQQRYPIPFDARRVAVWLALIICIVSIASYLPLDRSLPLLLLKLGIVAGYMLLMVRLGNLSRLRTMYSVPGAKAIQSRSSTE